MEGRSVRKKRQSGDKYICDVYRYLTGFSIKNITTRLYPDTDFVPYLREK